MPHAKVVASGIAGALATILVWVLSMEGIDTPGDVAAAFVVVIGFLAGYFTPPTKA